MRGLFGITEVLAAVRIGREMAALFGCICMNHSMMGLTSSLLWKVRALEQFLQSNLSCGPPPARPFLLNPPMKNRMNSGRRATSPQPGNEGPDFSLMFPIRAASTATRVAVDKQNVFVSFQ